MHVVVAAESHEPRILVPCVWRVKFPAAGRGKPGSIRGMAGTPAQRGAFATHPEWKPFNSLPAGNRFLGLGDAPLSTPNIT